jgi:hypothetical protein
MTLISQTNEDTIMVIRTCFSNQFLETWMEHVGAYCKALEGDEQKNFLRKSEHEWHCLHSRVQLTLSHIDTLSVSACQHRVDRSKMTNMLILLVVGTLIKALHEQRVVNLGGQVRETSPEK